jgi:DNA repair protein SbcC/Rad50
MTKLEDIVQLSITDFRSIAGTSVIPLDAPIILIHGPNGAGKTSILSALELALTGNIPAMAADDVNFARYLVHEGAAEARIEITDSSRSVNGGRYVVKDGKLQGEPYLDPRDRRFFGERCYLAQSMLGRLLDIYQNSEVEDGESALTQFVKDLLGLNQLDALVEGLHDAGHKGRTKNLVPEYRTFEERVERTELEITQFTDELGELDSNRQTTMARLSAAWLALFEDEPLATTDLNAVGERLRALASDTSLIEVTRRQTELRSLARAWGSLPKGGNSDERAKVESEEQAAGSAADEWRGLAGQQLEEVIVALREYFPDLASWTSTDPTSARQAADARVVAELSRLGTLLDKDAAAEKREKELSEQVAKEEARGQLIDTQIAGIARDAGEYAGALAGLVPHVHTEDCPVCGRNFGEVSPTESLSEHLQKTIAKLTEDAGRLSALSAEKSGTVKRIAQLRRELSSVRSERLTSEVKAQSTRLRADLTESKVALDRLATPSTNGTALLSRAATLRGRLASFRERDRSATDYLATLTRIAGDMGREELQPLGFEQMLGVLQTFVDAEVQRLGSLQSQRDAALLSYQAISAGEQRRRIVAGDLSRTQETLSILKGAVVELETLKAQAKVIADTARSSRTAIVRRVFNDSMNKLWRDLFVRLAPTEPFVPAFKVPESDSADFAKLETVHRSGRKGGTPGAMLSAGNLNTAALTLFLALHFSVGSRLPWLVLDDPVQNMDEVHIAQFAALLRTISRAHGTKVVIAVHERPLFEYLKLELSPAFEKDRLQTLELRRTRGEPTRIVPELVTYAVDAVAAYA